MDAIEMLKEFAGAVLFAVTMVALTYVILSL